jgi:hypothetical protein
MLMLISGNIFISGTNMLYKIIFTVLSEQKSDPKTKLDILYISIYYLYLLEHHRMK